MQIVGSYQGVIKKVCFMYSSPGAPFDDLYQETLANIWTGFGSFRGESKMSTWIYRTAINTCVTWYRRNSRHNNALPLDDIVESVSAEYDSEYKQNLAELYKLISSLNPLEKGIIMMWLDNKSYDEISEVTGLARGAVATRLHRIKQKLKEKSDS